MREASHRCTAKTDNHNSIVVKISESRGRKRKQSSEKDLEQELELLKMKFRKLEEQLTSGAGTEGKNHMDQASYARTPDRSSLDEGYTSSGAAGNAPKPPLESDVKRIHDNESHRCQRNVQHAPPKHVNDSKVIKSNNSPVQSSSPEGNIDKISRYKPPSPRPSHSKDVTFNPQTVSMQSQTVTKTESSVTLVNNIQHLSIAQKFLCIPPKLPNNMRIKKLNNIPSASPESKEGNILTNKRSSSQINNIHPEMAERLHFVLQNGMPKEERYHLQEKYKIPNNCTLMKAPILNPEVIPFMDEVAKKRDASMFKYQDQLGAGMVAIAEGVTKLQASRSGNGGFKTSMEHIHRGLHLLADLHNNQTRVRRIVCTPVDSMLKSFLVEKLSHRHHNFQDINHLFKRDDTIFGRDIGCMLNEFIIK